MRVTRAWIAIAAAAAVAAACAREEKRVAPTFDAAPKPDAEPPVKPIAAPALPAVEGASLENGGKLFASLCADCHGDDAKTIGEKGKTFAVAPTDLTAAKYLCRSTIGAPIAVPSDQDIETAIDRGSHKAVKEIAALDAPSRRSLTLFLKSLSPELNRPPQPLAPVPPAPADTPASRKRGRLAYLAFGCWQCHGTDGKGMHATSPEFFAWNDRPLKAIKPLVDEKSYLCGDSPERTYLTISIGLGSGLMPAFGPMAEVIGQPETPPKDWGKSLRGKVPDEEVTAIRGWYGQLPEMLYVRGMKPSQKRERAAQFIWDLVHYVRSLE